MSVRLLSIAGLAMTMGCEQPIDSPGPTEIFDPTYQGIETRLLDGDLVNFRVAMSGAQRADQVEAYVKCAAAQYALIRGFGFARNVRTVVDEKDGVWTGDAVYTISPALPRGSRTIDAEVTVADCALRDIPTV